VSQYNFDEIVTLPGRGPMTLRTAIKTVMNLPPPPPSSTRQTSLFRDAGLSPSIYDFADIEQMAALL